MDEENRESSMNPVPDAGAGKAGFNPLEPFTEKDIVSESYIPPEPPAGQTPETVTETPVPDETEAGNTGLDAVSESDTEVEGSASDESGPSPDNDKPSDDDTVLTDKERKEFADIFSRPAEEREPENKEEPKPPHDPRLVKRPPRASLPDSLPDEEVSSPSPDMESSPSVSASVSEFRPSFTDDAPDVPEEPDIPEDMAGSVSGDDGMPGSHDAGRPARAGGINSRYQTSPHGMPGMDREDPLRKNFRENVDRHTGRLHERPDESSSSFNGDRLSGRPQNHSSVPHGSDRDDLHVTPPFNARFTGAAASGPQGKPSSEPVRAGPSSASSERKGQEEASVPPEKTSDGTNGRAAEPASSPVADGTGPTDNSGERFDTSYKKVSAAEAAASVPHSEPKKLNKKLILGVVIVVIGSIFLISFLSPAGGVKKKADSSKPQATVSGGYDYQGTAKKQDTGYQAPVVEEEPAQTGTALPYDEVNRIVEAGKGGETASGTSSGTQSSSSGTTSSTPSTVYTVTVPDTRTSSLPFSIPGINGVNYTPPETPSSSSSRGQNGYGPSGYQPGLVEYELPSREDYLNDVLSAYGDYYGNSGAQTASMAGGTSYAQQNDQAGKNEFFNNGAAGAGQGQWLAQNTIWQGTIIDAVLTTELNTDLPGQIIARVTKNVYSSQDGKYLLIPQNSLLYGTYNSTITFSQSRVQVGWNTLIRPDGYQVQLGNMPGTDEGGSSGLEGSVNNHFWQYAKAFALISSFDILDKEIEAYNSTNNQYVNNAAETAAEIAGAFAGGIIERSLNIQPTIRIKAGTKTNIIVNQTLTLPPVEDFPVTQKYER